MAIALRRALISSRNLSLLLRTSSLHSPDHSHFASSPPCLYNSSPTHAGPNFPAINFNGDTRRGFAKGRKSKGDDDANTVEIVDIGPSVKATAVSLMEAAVDALSRELSKLRTGRASAGILDHIIVETGGVKMPLSRLAVVSVIDSKTLSVTPYDPNALKALESAIVSSPLGLNPKVDGQRLMAPIPPLTKEHMQALCKVVTKSSEDVKQSIRRARQKYNELSSTNQAANKYYKFSHLLKAEAAAMALDTIKKAGSSFPKDAAKRLEKEVDDLTKKFIKSAEDMCKAKEKEIAAG